MKKFGKIFIFGALFLLVAGISAGGTYYYLDTQTKGKNSLIETLKKDVSDLTSKLSSLSQELAASRQKIVVYGDTRTGHEVNKGIVKLILEKDPVAVFHVGDLVEDGTKPDQWAIFNDISKELIKTTNFYPALGNHEKNSDLYYGNFELPNNEQWYSVNYNKIHFIVLDSNQDLSAGSTQYLWLENDLKNVSEKIQFTAIVLHHPPFSTGPHDEDEEGLRSSIVLLFEKYGVDIVFAGHDHDYERSFNNNIYYIVTGGGGAPLGDQKRQSPASQKFLKTYNYTVLEIINNELQMSVYDLDSKLIDQVTIKK